MSGREKILAYALLRIAIGINFAGHGLIRLHIGLARFASTTAATQANSPLPYGLTYGFLYLVPIVEAVVGLALILGLGTRFALVLASLLMFCLTVGVTANQQWSAASEQLLYSAVLAALLFLVDSNQLSLDRLLRR